MDTLTAEEVQQAQERGCTVQRFSPDKDESDLELAIEAAHQRGASRLSILGALGGEWDHCIANLLAPLSRCQARGVWSRLVTETAEVYLLSPGSYRVQGVSKNRVSLAALSSEVKGLSLEGFQYELQDSSLCRSQTRGLANALVLQEARVTLKEGELLLTFQR